MKNDSKEQQILLTAAPPPSPFVVRSLSGISLGFDESSNDEELTKVEIVEENIDDDHPKDDKTKRNVSINASRKKSNSIWKISLFKFKQRTKYKLITDSEPQEETIRDECNNMDTLDLALKKLGF